MVSARQQAYMGMFPIKYHVYRAQAGVAGGSVSPNDITPYTCVYFNLNNGPHGSYNFAQASWRPFADVPQYGGTAPVLSGEGTPEQWAYATSDSRFLQNHTYKLPTRVNGFPKVC